VINKKVVDFETFNKMFENKVYGLDKSKFKIRPYKPEDKEVLSELVIEAYGHVMSPQDILKYIFDVIDCDETVIAEYDNKVVGFFIFSTKRNEEIIEKYNLQHLKNKKGVEGIGVYLKPEYRKNSLGWELCTYPKTTGYDYIYGLIIDGLDTLNMWMFRGGVKLDDYIDEDGHVILLFKELT